MFRATNGIIGIVNFVTFLLSFPILIGGIWLSTKATQTDCMKFLQWPVIVLGVTIMVISLTGFAGSCYRISWLLWLYLFSMFFVIACLFGLVIFVYAVTAKGSGRPLRNRAYEDYDLADYSGWLKDRVSDRHNWKKIMSCIHDSKTCAKTGKYIVGVPETPDMFYRRHLSPIESGCCKPPSSCGYIYVNETVWNPNPGPLLADPDCARWSNEQDKLCYSCDSCKAGVLASLKKTWRKVSVINLVVLVLLVILYIVGCAAFHNNKKLDNDEPHGMIRMTKERPVRF